MRRLFIAIAILALVAAGATGFAAWRYRREMAIQTANGINEASFVRIGGIDQWIQIRGQDRANPVLLWLNGGPGFSTIPSTLRFRGWEKYFTVVMWDQRGEGKTFQRSGTSVAPTMTITQMAEDGLEVARYLRTHLHKDKIILLGHSWGSILGTHMASREPDLFYAYVGTGQVSRLKDDIAAAYPRLLAYARKTQDKQATRELVAIGPPPYRKLADEYTLLKWANALDPPIHLTLSLAGLWGLATTDRAELYGGAEFSQDHVMPQMMDDDLESLAVRLTEPVIIIDGPDGFLTPNARSFFDKVAAPHKEFFSIPGTGHLAIFQAPEKFLAILAAHVRPLAMPPIGAGQKPE
jgi:pimeloyl-ACP methyl ester carboxylesterase